jgi:hypothetical protein
LWPWRHKNLNGIRVNYLHHLDGGVIVLEENSEGSTAESFRDMIEKAGLEISFVEFGSKHRTPHGHLYYIGIVRRGGCCACMDEGPNFLLGCQRDCPSDTR